MYEDQLRLLARDWLKERYKLYKKHLDFRIFHNKGFLINYISKKFVGANLTTIPNYDRVNIEPDIAGIIIHNETKVKLWIIGECKCTSKSKQSISQSDLVQAKDYSNVANAYIGFFFYYGKLSYPVLEDLKSHRHRYKGMNKWGKCVSKELKICRYDHLDNTFRC